MEKQKIAVIFGGKSTEHNVSNVSGTSVISHLNKDKYDITPIYISKDGQWYFYKKNVEEITIMKVDEEPVGLEKIQNITDTLKSFDVVFPVLHGLYGEDGTIQGLLKMLNVPFVGCEVLSSAVSMDKAYTKVIMDKAKIPQAKYMYIKKSGEEYSYIDDEFNKIAYKLNDLADVVEEKLGLPVFVKPSNSGSSVGIKKAENKDQIVKCIENAAKYDNKIIIEEAINAREIECAVLGNDDLSTSVLGEILPVQEFYNYDAKYNDANSGLQIPAELSEDLTKQIQEYAKKVFVALDCKGLSRVDFFVDKQTNKIYFNEVNTMPGFTTISMYPQLFEKCGLPYEKLLENLIELAKKAR